MKCYLIFEKMSGKSINGPVMTQIFHKICRFMKETVGYTEMHYFCIPEDRIFGG